MYNSRPTTTAAALRKEGLNVARVYVETSIPSFYYEVRGEPDMIARREWTQAWWSAASRSEELVSSAAVVEELTRGDYPNKNQCLELMSRLPLLPIEPIIEDIVEQYIKNHVMPRDPSGDALHLAIASYHRCDFLITWNCRNLANANKFGHIRQLNTLMGLYVPAIVTPLELIQGEIDEDSGPDN